MNAAKKQGTKVLRLPALFLLTALLYSCGNKEAPAGTVAVDKDSSYAIGMFFAEQMSFTVRTQYDYKALMEGFRDFNEQQETRLSREEMYDRINVFFALLNEEAGKTEKGAGDEFLASNAQRPEVSVTASGLQYEVIAEGGGPKPGPQDLVMVNYEGTLLDGTVFDSSYNRGEPAIFGLSQVIRGWTEGIQLMSTGSSYRFYIPSELAYGPQGISGVIPPNAVLVFFVELLGIEGFSGAE